MKRRYRPSQDTAAVLEPPDDAPEDRTDDGLGSAGQTREGFVFRKSQGQYDVRVDARGVPCTLSSRLRKQLVYPLADPGSLHQRVVAVEDIRAVDPVAIGDIVRFLDAGDGTGVITAVQPRRSKLARRAAGTRPIEQVIVANVDQVVIICAAAQPAPSWNLVDRYLAAAEASEAPALLCLTKLDLVDDTALHDEVATYRALGYPVHLTSAQTGEGVAKLADALRNRLSVLAGKSGAGKTSMLNALQPGLGLRVSEVSGATGKGRHTTTHLEAFPLDNGGSVVDTPGMREFGLWDVAPDEVAPLFREFRQYLGTCRFGASCRHLREPGCAVIQAVADGAVSQRRYESFCRMAR